MLKPCFEITLRRSSVHTKPIVESFDHRSSRLSCGSCQPMESNSDFTPPLISVIVPCFNYGNYIADTLESVQRQSYDKWECIVVDDGSTDNSREVVNNFIASDSRFTYIYQENQGLSAARNSGMKRSTGKYIQYLDSDDCLQPDKLRSQCEFLEKNLEIDIVYGRVTLFTDDNLAQIRSSEWSYSGPWKPGISEPGLGAQRSLLHFNTIAVNTVLMRGSVIESVGFFDETLKGVEDWDFWLRCAVAGCRFQYDDAPETWALVRKHSGGMMKNTHKQLVATLAMRAKMNDLLSDPEMLNMNHKQIDKEHVGLWIVQAGEGQWLRSFLRLIGMGIRRGNIKWIMYALVTPFLRIPFVARLRERRRAARLERSK